MINQTKDSINQENESTDKIQNINESSSFEANLSPQIIQQLYELTKKTIDKRDETTQTFVYQQTSETPLNQGSSSDLDMINSEQDVYYQTVVEIFLFFRRRFSIPFILNTIHQSAGDIPTALQKLNHAIPKGEEPCNFSYHKISGTKEQIDAYFTF